MVQFPFPPQMTKFFSLPLHAGSQTLTNVGAAYDTVAVGGFLSVDWTLFPAGKFVLVRLILRVNKIGSGIQTWQFWNDSDAAEILNIADSGAAGVKILDSGYVAFTPPSILKNYRLRAKSSVAADDPILLGASVIWKHS